MTQGRKKTLVSPTSYTASMGAGALAGAAGGAMGGAGAPGRAQAGYVAGGAAGGALFGAAMAHSHRKARGLKLTGKANPVEKAWKGEPGDKRNTKYFGAAAAGLPLAGPIGSAAGVTGYAMYRNMSETGKKRRAVSIKAKKAKLSKSAFGVEHEVSKGSPKLGLRMIGAYGKKPTESMASIKRAAVGGKGKKRDNSLGDTS